MHLRVHSTHFAYQVPSHLGSHPIVIPSVYQHACLELVIPKGFLGASLTRQLVKFLGYWSEKPPEIWLAPIDTHEHSYTLTGGALLYPASCHVS